MVKLGDVDVLGSFIFKYETTEIAIKRGPVTIRTDEVGNI